jgi:hypothetical protein
VEAYERQEGEMRIRGVFTALLLALAVLGAGCGNSSHPTAAATSVALARVDSVHVVRTSDVPQSQLAPFDHTGHDAASAHALYAGLYALPAYVASGVPCPPDLGAQYQLTFSYGGKLVLNAIADPSGCQVVVLGGHDNRKALHSNLWALLAAAVGTPLAAVYPLPTH